MSRPPHHRQLVGPALSGWRRNTRIQLLPLSAGHPKHRELPTPDPSERLPPPLGSRPPTIPRAEKRPGEPGLTGQPSPFRSPRCRPLPRWRSPVCRITSRAEEMSRDESTHLPATASLFTAEMTDQIMKTTSSPTNHPAARAQPGSVRVAATLGTICYKPLLQECGDPVIELPRLANSAGVTAQSAYCFPPWRIRRPRCPTQHLGAESRSPCPPKSKRASARGPSPSCRLGVR